MLPLARTALAVASAGLVLRCSLFVDTAGLAGAALDAADAPASETSAEAAPLDASGDAAQDADAGDGARGDAAVWPVNGHAYLAVATPIPISWPSAKLAAEARGGHLATITSDQENAFVYSLVRDRDELFEPTELRLGPWLGGRRLDKTSVNPADGWSWSTGEAWGYTSWGPGQPDDHNQDEDRLHYYAAPDRTFATWNDAPQSAPYVNSYVIEFE